MQYSRFVAKCREAGRSIIVADADYIFFDVDGTLVDSGKDIASAVNYTLRKMGYPAQPEGLLISYIGTGTKDLLEKSLGAGDPAMIEKATEIFSSYYAEHMIEASKLYPHTEEVLEYFNTKKKYILTNRFTSLAEKTLAGFGIRRYFEGIFGGDDENCLKPSACVMDSIVSKLRIDRSKAMIVGDMAVDIMTGKNSGIKTCWVRYGLGKARDVEPLKPDFAIDDLLELEKIIR